MPTVGNKQEVKEHIALTPVLTSPGTAQDGPCIDILMPSYNSGAYLYEAVQSALSQMGPRDRLIVQDAVSTDNTLEILRRINDSRLSVISEKDNGQAHALNLALARSTADWVGWLNADDLYLPGGLSAVRGSMLADCDVVIGDFQLINGDGRIQSLMKPKLATLESIIWGRLIPFSGALFVRREFLDSVGSFDPRYNFCMDYELYLRLWARPELRVAKVEAYVGALRIYDGTKTASSPWGFVREARRARATSMRTWSHRVIGTCATVFHAALALSGRVRSTDVYRRIREHWR